MAGELQTATVDAGLDGAFRQSELVRDFLIRKLLEIPEHDRFAQRRRELGKRLADALAEIDLLEFAVRTALARHRHQRRRIHIAGHRLALLPDAAVMVDAQIAADADEPGLEVRPPIERVQGAENLEEDVLRQVFGFVVTADELVGEIEDLPPVLPDDLVPGALIAGETLLDQRVNGRKRWCVGIGGHVTGDAGALGIITNGPAGPGGRRRAGRMSGRMHGFERRQGHLHCEDVPLSRIAAEAGTPVFVYAGGLMRARYRELDEAFAGYPHRLHYAIKANATLGVVRLMRELGAGADANSGGELEVALRAGFAPPEVVFTGVGKTRTELERAIGLGVAAINAESIGEMNRIAAIATALGVRANVAVRVNPDIEAGSHPHISTGHRATKFGMSMADAAALIHEMAARPSLRVVGLHVHIGSQITRPEPLERAACAVADLARHLMAEGLALEHLDVGGGLGIAYEPGQAVVPVRDYAAAVLRAVRPTGLTLLLEPGRWLVAPAGVLVAEVVDTKPQGADGRFVVVDAGMTELLRPALYGAYHHIEPVSEIPGGMVRTDVVGPVCETSDTLGRDRQLPAVDVGDLLAIRDTGAYGSVMSSNYNRRLAAAEVLVDDGAWRVIRRRQTIDDLLQWDT